MRRPVKPGTVVRTHTVSGEPIWCTVIKQYEETGEYLLESPAHGYAIVRWRREFVIEKESAQERG